MSTLVWSPMDPDYPLPTGQHCEVCGCWTRDGDLCAACDREVHAGMEVER